MMTYLLINLVFAVTAAPVFPPAVVSFDAYEKNPVFVAGGAGHWDEHIRERGWVMREGPEWKLWYTGYDSEKGMRKLGYATSEDGLNWTRYAGNPIVGDAWVEDVMVVKVGEKYFMYSEGERDRAHLLTSVDGIHWQREGTLDIRKVDGSPIEDGPFGTPSVWVEDGVWWLFYERDDVAIWVAKGTDGKKFVNVQDAPVIARGPEAYDKTMVAADQVIKYGGQYYLYYHATCPENGRDQWTMNVAGSGDLVHWEKYAGNPIIGKNHSSGMVVADATGKLRMYCAHPSVWVYMPKLTALE